VGRNSTVTAFASALSGPNYPTANQTSAMTEANGAARKSTSAPSVLIYSTGQQASAIAGQNPMTQRKRIMPWELASDTAGVNYLAIGYFSYRMQ